MARVPRRASSLSLVRGTAGDGAVASINAEAHDDEERRP
jgi:hypothetical protein